MTTYTQTQTQSSTTYTQTQTQPSTKRPDNSLYAQHLEQLTKLGINVDEVSTS
jgi:hypothetical protein